MQYSEYGRTGKMVSAVGFGGMRFDTKLPMEENAELVRYACSKGINYFDTAPGYCGDKSEAIFGLAFKDMPGNYYVSTKANPDFITTAQQGREAVAKSLERMGIPKIHFFHVWCLRSMDHYNAAVRPGGLYEGLERCKQEGLIEHIVFSTHQPGWEVRQILDSGKFEGVTMGVNILNFPFRWDGVQAAAEAGCGVAAMNPLGGGAIPQHEAQLAFLASAGQSPTEAALRFIISCPQINVALVGFSRRQHVDMACSVAQDARPYTPADLEQIGKHLSESMNAMCTGCGYCDGCPRDIPVATYMQVYNEKVVFGKTDEQMPRLLEIQRKWGMLIGRRADADACTECGQCEDACTQHLDITARLKQIAEWEKAKQP